MFRKSNLLVAALALAVLAAQSTITTGTAMTLSVGRGPVSPVETVRMCPGGTHEGYLGKYCWRDRGSSACPVGSHLGYEGKYCWRNH